MYSGGKHVTYCFAMMSYLYYCRLPGNDNILYIADFKFVCSRPIKSLSIIETINFLQFYTKRSNSCFLYYYQHKI